MRQDLFVNSNSIWARGASPWLCNVQKNEKETWKQKMQKTSRKKSWFIELVNFLGVFCP